MQEASDAWPPERSVSDALAELAALIRTLARSLEVGDGDAAERAAAALAELRAPVRFSVGGPLAAPPAQ
ncbi:unnamed protein product, partial [Polarella glacialis]